MYLKDYAMKILSDHGCDCYSYGGVDGEEILRDLKEAYPDGMEFPYVDVANMIMSISKMKPIERSLWDVLYSTDSFCDSFKCDSFGSAKANAEDTLVDWMCEERESWGDVYNPTEDELEDYNCMIDSCYVEVRKYNPLTDEYEEFWTPSDEDLESLGWVELTMEDIASERDC